MYVNNNYTQYVSQLKVNSLYFEAASPKAASAGFCPLPTFQRLWEKKGYC